MGQKCDASRMGAVRFFFFFWRGGWEQYVNTCVRPHQMARDQAVQSEGRNRDARVLDRGPCFPSGWTGPGDGTGSVLYGPAHHGAAGFSKPTKSWQRSFAPDES